MNYTPAMDKLSNTPIRTNDNKPDSAPSASGVLKKLFVKRQYSEDYIVCGFSWCGNGKATKVLCVFCVKQLANEAIIPEWGWSKGAVASP